MARIDQCRQDPLRSLEINVEGVCGLVRKLLVKGVFVVYLSTNQIFDGEEAQQKEDRPYAPLTEYGRQKVEAEMRIRTLKRDWAIVRLTKVISPSEPLFKNWREALLRGEVIHPFSDLKLAPVPLISIVSILELVADRKSLGILHVSSDDELSYAEAAFLAAAELKVPVNLVTPINASRSGRYPEVVPKHASLDTRRLKSDFNIHIPSAEWTVRQFFREPGKLSVDPNILTASDV